MPIQPPPQEGDPDSAAEHQRGGSVASGPSSVPTLPARRGRPPGSVSLTEEIAHTIVSYIRAGAFDHAAAEAAEISVRTFRDWMARGEGTHPTRPSSPKLRRFAMQVRRAKAEARISAEAEVHRQHPAQWLKWAARTTPEQDGWTELGPAEKAAAPGSSLAERLAFAEELAALRARQEDGGGLGGPGGHFGMPRPPVFLHLPPEEVRR